MVIPDRLARGWQGDEQGEAWLRGLPDAVHELTDRWSLSLGRPFDHEEVSCAWVAPARRPDGSHAVLKLGLPHFEAEHEIAGLSFWSGEPTVRLLEADHDLNALLLERCHPGTPLRALPEREQDVVLAGLLRRLWRKPEEGVPFRHLSELRSQWVELSSLDPNRHDLPLIRDGRALFDELASSSEDDVLLATDLHAGNVLRAEREPWLVIDPKPFLGDPAYDATQHLLNCEARLCSDPFGTLTRVAELLDVDAERVRRWLFSRVAGERLPSDGSDDLLALARKLAPQ
ncbi:MAG: aminoglycoside phosphotransferase family protein [Acidobacteriota bacterium]